MYKQFVLATLTRDSSIHLGNTAYKVLNKKVDNRSPPSLPSQPIPLPEHSLFVYDVPTLCPRLYSHTVVLDHNSAFQTLYYFLCASFQKDGKTTQMAILERYDHVSYGQSQKILFDFTKAKVFKQYETDLCVTPDTLIVFLGILTDDKFNIIKNDNFQPFHFASDSTLKKERLKRDRALKEKSRVISPPCIISPKMDGGQSSPSPSIVGQKRVRQDNDDDRSAKLVSVTPFQGLIQITPPQILNPQNQVSVPSWEIDPHDEFFFQNMDFFKSNQQKE